MAVDTLTDAWRLAALVAASESALVTVDLDGIVTTWNAGAERLSGRSADGVLGEPLVAAVPALARAEAAVLLERALGGETVQGLQTLWPTPGGGTIHVTVSMTPVAGDHGAVLGASIILRDVSDARATARRLRLSEEGSRLVLELAPDAFVGMDADGLIDGWNRAAEALFGWRADEVIGRSLAETIMPERFRAMHEAGRRRFLASGESRVANRPLELAAQHRDGSEFPIELTLSPIRTGDGWAFSSFIRDLRARDEAAADRARLAAIIDSSDDAIISTDLAGAITTWNPAAERLLGRPAESAVGRPTSALMPPDRRGEDRRLLELVIDGERVDGLETEWLHTDGRRLEVSLTVSPVRDGAGSTVGASIIARETGERLRRARRDALTSLPNREVFVERLAASLEACAPQYEAVAAAVVDVDRLQELNEALGREGGDAVLCGLAGALASVLPPGAALARIGGDHFGVMLRGARDSVGEALATALQSMLPAVVAVDDVALHVDASIGYAVGPGDARHGDDLLAAAERALTQAKRSRSGLERYERALDGPRSLPVTMPGQVRQALARGELVLHVQPQVEVATGAIVGAEGLIRWQHPERGLLGPGAFLPAVERSSLMRSLTVEALGQALSIARGWQDAGVGVPVSVNLSALNLLDLAIAHDVARLLGEHGVSAGCLRLEITEDSLMVDPERSLGVLAGLRAMGVELAIDDFGTGHSSLAYLQRLPVSELKIDRTFVRDLARSDADAAIVGAAIQMGHGLGLRVVAEGIEDEEALGRLRALGCDLAQGFHLGRPMPPGDLTALLRGDAPA